MNSLQDGGQFRLAVPVAIAGTREVPVGTAFPVFGDKDRSVFMTARHVAETHPKLAVVTAYGTPPAPSIGGTVMLRECAVAEALTSKRFDVALLVTKEPLDSPASPLPFGRTPNITAQFLSVEYTESLKDPSYGLVRAEPTYHVGHALRRTWLSDRLTGNRMGVMLLPWAAFKGASGAPLVEMNPNGWTIAGMILENQEAERLPAHLETVVTQDGEFVESLKYFLPTAVAINESHLVEVVTDEFGVLFRTT